MLILFFDTYIVSGVGHPGGSSQCKKRANRSSGLIQLSKLIPLDILYQAQHDAGAVGKIWEKHHKAFANFPNKTLPSSVLEIGGAHGS